MQIKTKTLSEELNKNEKETKPLKNSELNIMEDIIDLQKTMKRSHAENKIVAEFDENNPFSAKTVPMSRYSSKDSVLSSETT